MMSFSTLPDTMLICSTQVNMFLLWSPLCKDLNFLYIGVPNDRLNSDFRLELKTDLYYHGLETLFLCLKVFNRAGEFNSAPKNPITTQSQCHTKIYNFDLKRLKSDLYKLET